MKTMRTMIQPWSAKIVKWCFPFCFMMLLPLTIYAQIGSWKAYMSYYEPQQIVKAQNTLFVRASNNLYQYNLNDHSIVTYDKTNALNDNNIRLIGWNNEAKRLLIVYDNSNFDIMDINGNVNNLSALYNKSMTQSKGINHIYMDGVYAYLATDFGVMKVNMQRYEISETYNLKQTISAVGINNDNIYARTADAVIAAPLTANLINPSSWNTTTDYPTNIFDQDLTDWNEYLQVVSTLKPGGPKSKYFGFMKFMNNRLYTCAGFLAQNIPGDIQILKDNEWEIYQTDNISEQTGIRFYNVYCLDYDPLDDTHVFAGARSGLYEFRNGQFVNFFNNDNSPIEPFDGTNKDYQLVTGVKFDTKGHLWILNSEGITQSLIELNTNRQFISHSVPELMKLDNTGFKNKSNPALLNMMIDSQGYLWFVNDDWRIPAAYRYNLTTGNINVYSDFHNQDGVDIAVGGGVRCIVEDQNKNIWLGTNVGPILIENNQIDSSSPVYTQVKVPRNDGTDYADYLLSGVDIKSMAIDGGGRKWFGTYGNGVYLISSDNMQQIHHFTTQNSPLLSDNVLSIAINNTTGEVFFGTSEGLCSYMGDAVTAVETMTKDDVYAYPNPVVSGYDGLITIVGLSMDADVKIVSTSGQLVAQGRSNGGTFTWNGCDRSGRRVASGVYMVVTATSDGSKGTVCKIAIIK